MRDTLGARAPAPLPYAAPALFSQDEVSLGLQFQLHCQEIVVQACSG